MAISPVQFFMQSVSKPPSNIEESLLPLLSLPPNATNNKLFITPHLDMKAGASSLKQISTQYIQTLGFLNDEYTVRDRITPLGFHHSISTYLSPTSET
jgi:hypothetical protein